jgi:hypothetical protein
MAPHSGTGRSEGSGTGRPRKLKKKYGYNAMDMDEHCATTIRDLSGLSNEYCEKEIFITTHSQPLTLFDKRKPEYQKQLIRDAKDA